MILMLRLEPLLLASLQAFEEPSAVVDYCCYLWNYCTDIGILIPDPVKSVGLDIMIKNDTLYRHLSGHNQEMQDLFVGRLVQLILSIYHSTATVIGPLLTAPGGRLLFFPMEYGRYPMGTYHEGIVIEVNR